MKIVTWNINSIKVRLERVLNFCQRLQPDVLCLQELKCLEENFPLQQFKDIGYHVAVYGQKQYNGTAIISKHELTEIKKNFSSSAGFSNEARWIQAKIRDLYVVSIYAPNGGEVGSDKYAYKLRWYEQMQCYLQESFRPEAKVVLAGDFNVAPTDMDVYDPKLRAGMILCSQPERDAFQNICNLGYHDYLRSKYPSDKIYSWWGYQELSFPLNKGFRIDFNLVSSSLLPSCQDTWIERDERKGKKPSDHAPVVLKIK